MAYEGKFVGIQEENVGCYHEEQRWWSARSVAVVTGANRGIGFEIVKKLWLQGLTVVLTCRDPHKGKQALDSLSSSCSNNSKPNQLLFHPLDIFDVESISCFITWLVKTTGGLDILINNAAVSCKKDVDDNSLENAETVMKTNYHGTKCLTNALLPFFRPSPASSRILFLSSRLGSFQKLQNPRLRKVLEDVERLTERKLDEIAESFMKDVEKGSWSAKGWPSVWTDYSVSKLLLNAYAQLLGRNLQGKKGIGERISVNCYCPGFTRTSMTNGVGKYSPEEAASNAVFLALLPPSQLSTATFFHSSKQENILFLSRL